LKQVAFVVDSNHGDYTPDDGLAVSALNAADIHVSAPVWNDPTVDWTRFDLVVVRTTWDYSRNIDAFLNWLDRLETAQIKLWNPPSIMRWNADKNYLREMETRGAAILPTAWYGSGMVVDLVTELAQRGWSDVVVKPTVSAGSRRTWHLTAPFTEADQSHLSEILIDSGAMIQPFAESILTEGEWSFVFFNRQFSHAVLKKAQQGDFRVQIQFGGAANPVEPPPTLLTQAAQVLDQVESPLLYTRVDGVNVDGRFQLMELELIEPRLFLSTNALAPTRFADAILQLL